MKPANLRYNDWNVFLHGRLIDTVCFTSGCDRAYVYQNLVNHDGFDPSIKVYKK
jgi:hypothetical protein